MATELPADIATAIDALQARAWTSGRHDDDGSRADAARAALDAAILTRLATAAEDDAEATCLHVRIEKLEKALRFTDATVTAFMDWLAKEDAGLEAPMPLALAMIDARQQRQAALTEQD